MSACKFISCQGMFEACGIEPDNCESLAVMLTMARKAFLPFYFNGRMIPLLFRLEAFDLEMAFNAFGRSSFFTEIVALFTV
jgi:hypothetical protein